jgi:predicted site-specific integrase-resolvase
MSSFKKEDFTCTVQDLADRHGIHTITVNAWSRQGAFPYMYLNIGGRKKVYHKSALNFFGSEIKRNREQKKYAVSFGVIREKEKKISLEIRIERLETIVASLIKRGTDELTTRN